MENLKCIFLLTDQSWICMVSEFVTILQRQSVTWVFALKYETVVGKCDDEEEARFRV